MSTLFVFQWTAASTLIGEKFSQIGAQAIAHWRKLSPFALGRFGLAKTI